MTHSSATTIECLDPELVLKLEESQRCLEQLVRGGPWLVWSATVIATGNESDPWHWRFRREFSPILPAWFSAEAGDGESMASVINRTRLPEDSLECDVLFARALQNGDDGYSQMFRVRLRDNKINWVEENVAIVPIDHKSWRFVGICIDATARKQSEERLKALQQELVTREAELVAQNEELQALRDNLERDKLALAEANAKLENLATTDGLTGIKNHRAFQEQLERDWKAAERYGADLSLIILDIDQFKPFNDTFGHPAGDDVLKEVGVILQNNVRTSDCVARYGGEEFVIILPETDNDGAIQLGDRFRASIESAQWARRGITASVGVTTRGPRHREAQELIVEADRALYRAKADGRNCVRHYTAVDLSKAA